MADRYTENSTGKIFIVEKTMNDYGLDIVIFKLKANFQAEQRRLAMDLYSFNLNYTMVRDEDK